jgi:hypothetical protein
MATGDEWVDHAIAHEAGHILIGIAFELPIQGMSVEIAIEGNRIRLGNFITESKEPPDEQIPKLPASLLEHYKLFVGGGLAGNKFASQEALDESLQADRRQLKRVGTESLEDVAEKSLAILKDNPVIFKRLIDAIEKRFLWLMNDPYKKSGRYRLLTEKELKELCGIKDSPNDATKS